MNSQGFCCDKQKHCEFIWSWALGPGPWADFDGILTDADAILTDFEAILANVDTIFVDFDTILLMEEISQVKYTGTI